MSSFRHEKSGTGDSPDEWAGHRDGVVKNGTFTFGWFARNRYLPLKEADWREETPKVRKLIITAD